MVTDVKNTQGDSKFEPNPSEAILQTLEDYEAIITLGAPAVLYSRRWSNTELPRNLHAALAATNLGLRSLDYAKRMYTQERMPSKKSVAHDRFSKAVRSAHDYIYATRNELRQNPRDDPDHYGPFAAAVALQRLDSGFRAAALLYRLGLNLEGDAVARQILEQIAWALAIGHMSSLEEIQKVQSQASVGKLKKLLPHMGRLYGFLSDVAHASLDQHRSLVVLGHSDSDPGGVLLTWSRLADSANILLQLADAWVVVCQVTQADMLSEHPALASLTPVLVRDDRPFITQMHDLVNAIREVEAGSGQREG
jgi:hypothetical protein